MARVEIKCPHLLHASTVQASMGVSLKVVALLFMLPSNVPLYWQLILLQNAGANG